MFLCITTSRIISMAPFFKVANHYNRRCLRCSYSVLLIVVKLISYYCSHLRPHIIDDFCHATTTARLLCFDPSYTLPLNPHQGHSQWPRTWMVVLSISPNQLPPASL
ncbi:hypothetical protein VNO77_23389 [Canavalia gladiata]|uniref:Uncharacterized protein n=1 Tax=Canavalia gladiata TaxID=3824 RepID=A0AAN9QBN3_CANGL